MKEAGHDKVIENFTEKHQRFNRAGFDVDGDAGTIQLAH